MIDQKDSYTSKKYSALVCVGPGDREMDRLNDLVASLVRYESEHLLRLIVVDDTPHARDYGYISRTLAGAQLKVLINPRRSRGDGWRGGLAANVLYGLVESYKEAECTYVLKIDTDSLVIAPFHAPLVRFFEENAACGIAGSCYDLDLCGERTLDSTWAVNLSKWQRLLRLRRAPYPRLEQSFAGMNRNIRRVISSAQSRGEPTGYRLGNCAQGGGYAVRHEVLASLAERGWLEGDWWLSTDLGEDVVVSLLAIAAGWRIQDFNQPGQVFGVQYQGLAFSVDELHARGYSIVHSVRGQTWEAECKLRDEFRNATRAV